MNEPSDTDRFIARYAITGGSGGDEGIAISAPTPVEADNDLGG